MWINRSTFMAVSLALEVVAVTAGLFVRPVRAGKEPCEKTIDQPQPQADKRPGVAGTYRILVLDIQNKRGGNSHDLRLIEVASGKVLAQVDHVGYHTDLAVSPRGDVVAVLTSTQANRSLEFLRAGDLSRLEFGLLPASIHRIQYQQGASRDARFTPDGQQLLVQSITSARGASHLATTVLTSVERKLDDKRTYRLGPQSDEVTHSDGFSVVRVADWPRVHIWNTTLGLLEVADQKSGKITSKHYLGDGLKSTGFIVANGRYGYYIPRQPWNKNEPGFLKKVDLGVDPSKVVLTGENAEKALHPGPMVVSEAAAALFIVQARFPLNNLHQPARQLKVYGTKDLKLQREIELPLADCQAMDVSADGKYVYILSSSEAKVAVLDAATAKVVKVLDNLGAYPHIILAVPEAEK